MLAVAYERDLKSFADLLLVENLGPRTLQTLALVAEVIHGTPSRFQDPARFSFALGGKDRHPFPVPLKTFDESIAVLRNSLDICSGRRRRQDAKAFVDSIVSFAPLRRGCSPKPTWKLSWITSWRYLASLDGRSVFDDPTAQERPIKPLLARTYT